MAWNDRLESIWGFLVWDCGNEEGMSWAELWDTLSACCSWAGSATSHLDPLGASFNSALESTGKLGMVLLRGIYPAINEILRPSYLCDQEMVKIALCISPFVFLLTLLLVLSAALALQHSSVFSHYLNCVNILLFTTYCLFNICSEIHMSCHELKYLTV